MIKIEKAEVFGWEAAIRGMRNPLNSWDKGDSYSMLGLFDEEDFKEAKTEGIIPASAVYDHDFPTEGTTFVVGEADLGLMKSLAKAGSDHSKFLRMINVTVDITAPLYWWKEFDTYKVGTVANSCSTMHKITDKELTIDDFSHEHLNYCEGDEIDSLDILYDTITIMNLYREKYLKTKGKPTKDTEARDELLKRYWWQMIQLLPSSYNQKRTVQLNYQVLLAMYRARKNHKLDEWREFCEWIESLPYFSKICLEE